MARPSSTSLASAAGRSASAMRREALRQMGVAVERNAVVPQLCDLLQRGGEVEGEGVLARQAVDQIHADRLEAVGARRTHLARVDLDGDFGVGQQLEMAARHGHQARGFGVGQKRGRATAPVPLRHRQALTQQAGHPVHFLLDPIKIGRAARTFFGGNFVAAAVVAQGFAERDVHVQRPCVAPSRPRSRRAEAASAALKSGRKRSAVG